MPYDARVPKPARRRPLLGGQGDEVAALREELEQARAEVRDVRRRLRRTRERLRASRPRDDLGYLFVVTYGRSGSTLVQGLLNSIPGYAIRGENAQILRHLYEFHRTGMKLQRRGRGWLKSHPEYDEQPVTQPFYGAETYPRVPPHPLFRRIALDVLLGPGEDTRVVGFKEVHWDAPDNAQFVQWLQRVFPGARFLFNTRSLDDVARSAWWGDDPDSRSRLEQIEADLLELCAELGDTAYRIHYDDYTADPSVLAGLYEWLGEPFDLDRVRAVLGQEHSFQRKPATEVEQN